MLFIFLNKVANEPANRMTMENIAMVLAPNLFFPTSAVNYSKPETLDYEMKLAAATSKITLLLLTNFNNLQMVAF
jgi:RhoGAP domain